MRDLKSWNLIPIERDIVRQTTEQCSEKEINKFEFEFQLSMTLVHAVLVSLLLRISDFI